MRFLIGLVLFLAAGCATIDEQLEQVRVGMNEEQLSDAVGGPDHVKATLINKYGQEIIVWQYANSRAADEPYYFYFVEGKLALWGTAPNWQRMADQFASPPK